MSSDSEDEFQSADEGSDFEVEDLESSPKYSQNLQTSSEDASLCERVHDKQRDETNIERVREKLIEDNSVIEEAVVKGDSSLEGAVNTTEICKDNIDITKEVRDVSKSQASSSSRCEIITDSCMKSDENIEKKSNNQPEVSKYHENAVTKEIREKSDSTEEELQESNIELESNKENKASYSCDEQNDEVQSNNETEKEESGKIESKLEPASQTGSSEDSNTVVIADQTKVVSGNSKPKPIKQSKIGLKKPREKIGERLGARKLGAKITSISSDSVTSPNVMKHHKPEDRSVSLDERGGQTTVKKMENREEEDEKIKKRQQWEEQQERWHQALNVDKDKTEVSFGNDDGWSAPWGGWGNTLLSAASSFTREVGRGVGTVMETVESSIGVPSPEVMAQEVSESKRETALKDDSSLECTGQEKENEMDKDDGHVKSNIDGEKCPQQVEARHGLGGFSFGSLVSGVSGALETASSKVLMGGLDTLEVIGRKAMDVIQEGDPGLRRKREFLSQKKPNLAQILQEARQRALEEERDGAAGGRNKILQRLSFEQAWEGTEGPVHLEALSLVAKQCQSKKTSMIATLPHYIQEKLHRDNTLIKNTCELDEVDHQDEDVAEAVSSIVLNMGLPLNPRKLIDAWSSVQDKITLIQETGFEQTDESEGILYRTIAQLVAQLCALTHKGGELALISSEPDPLHLSSNFKALAQAVSYGLENTADQVCGTLTSEGSDGDTEISNTITHIYLQAASGNNYIQESLMLLSSILQYSNTKSAAANL